MVGRENTANRLQLMADGMAKQYGIAGSVPKSVSKQHCVLTIDREHNAMSIANHNLKNATYVNGLQVEKMEVTQHDVVELGLEHFRLNWQYVTNFVEEIERRSPGEVDVRHLEAVWLRYKHQQDKLQKSQAMTNVLKGGIPILTIGGIALGLFMSKDGQSTSNQTNILYSIAALLMIVLFVKSLFDAQRLPKEREKLNKEMLKHYVCPKPGCHYFFGFQPYDVIKSNLDCCPKCKSKLKK